MQVEGYRRVKWNDAKDAYVGLEVECEDMELTLDFTEEQWDRLMMGAEWSDD